MTLHDLAERLVRLGIDTSASSLRELERGDASVHMYDDPNVLRAIAETTGVDATWMLHGSTASHAAEIDTAAASGSLSGWVPELGDHVRVFISLTPGCEEYPHLAGEDGVTGKVVALRPAPGAPSHPYLVIFDEPLHCSTQAGSDIELRVRHYAGHELRPL